MEYWTHAAKLPIGMETPVLIRKRVMRVIAGLIRLSHGVGLEKGKCIRVLCVTHEEIMRDLLEEAFGSGTILGSGPGYGESLKIEILPDMVTKTATLSLTFREKESNLLFDMDTREIKR